MADRPTDHARAEAAFAEFRRSGSPRAMAEVFDRTAAELLLCARRFARDAAAAEDLVQQTFLRAIERAATFTPERQLMPWLTAILANEARMELRRRRTPDPDRLPPSASEEPSRTAERREAAAAMHAALAELPPAYRDVVTLRYLHDTRPGRIATALALPLPTVKTRLHRGVRKLKASLPRGLALGTAVTLCAGRGLPACRRAVLRGAATSTAAIWTLTGLFAMKKTVLPIATLALLLAAVWLLLPSIWSDSPAGSAPATAEAAGTIAGGANAPRVQRSDGEPAAAAVRTTVDVPQPERERRLHAIEVRARWRASGQPAANIPFTLLVQPATWLANATTNDSGTATFDIDRIDDLEHKARKGVSISCALRPGSYHNVSADDNDDSPRIVEVELDDGRQVTGIVLDATGLPVPGAAIWLTVDSYQPAMEFQHTDAAGRFMLRGLSADFTIRATHEGAMSADLVVASLEGDREAVLRLNATAARLEILVTDPTGNPLARTAVHLDDRNRNQRTYKRRFATTGADGRATLAGIDPAKYWLEVVHPSFAPAQLEIAIADDQLRRETIKLGPSAELAGCVRRGNGEPAVGVSVSVNDAASMFQRWTHTDPEGKFLLQGLAIGRHRLSISQGVPDHSRFIELRAGRQELEITVPGSSRIRGQLVDPDGRPLPGWQVQARPVSDFTPMHAYTDREGRFAFDGLSDSLHLLEVASQYTVATFLDVRTDGSEQVFRLPVNALPRAFLVGHIEGARDCSLVISPRINLGERRDQYLTVPADGRFEFGPLPPVTFDIGISLSTGNRTWWFTTVDLAAADRGDLGTIRMPEPGRLEVTVRDDLGCKQLSVGLRSVRAGGTHGEALERVDHGSWRASDLPAGEYDVCLYGEATAPVMQRVTVEPSRTTRIALATAPGALFAYRLAPPAGTPGEAVGWQMIAIRSADGRLVAFDKMMGSLNHSKRLLEGSYTFEVATGGGFHASAAVVVPTADGAEVAIPITR